MSRISRTIATFAVLGLIGVFAGACTSTRTTESAGEYVDDTVISTKVRGQIVGDKDLRLSQIDVETFKGVVQLSGFVDTEQTKNHAGFVARSVVGVRQVHNNLVVK